ncbi:MAG: undecaprenyldiphospho-muramoylpentapeptide beta-N-acetylglucosaminyltransferase [Cyanobacteria bacterium]|nr:undecaprenyldiphospho-muramoylpentapeptide beta-N-acetylglucosaminyltransferase [Cyanobacteriota bacterium]MDW8200721.1 undecaprenyldiphospho-muramoylpentapeptide beta-N-acetylglucosaminyltransferase [Cyanobacteriota bacterium SKYGB_h_bin112]
MKRLLIAASGTGGHVFPALAVAEQLAGWQIEWLGVSDRLETRLVPDCYPLHVIQVEGFQKKSILHRLRVVFKLLAAIGQVRRLLRQGKFSGVFTTGGYIAAPAILAAWSLGLPTILHESNALPGKVTRWLSPFCTTVAVGFAAATAYLPRAKTICLGTPVRSQFLTSVQESSLAELAIPENVPLIVVVGGSQGAVAVNRLVRQAAPVWLEAGAWIVHLTGETDRDAGSFTHDHYIALPFYDHMAGLLKRATLAISRAGAGTLTELAITHTPSILIPYPFAADDHQTYNARVFVSAGAAQSFSQAELTPELLASKVLHLLQSPEQLAQLAANAATLAVPDSAVRLAELVEQVIS